MLEDRCCLVVEYCCLIVIQRPLLCIGGEIPPPLPHWWLLLQSPLMMINDWPVWRKWLCDKSSFLGNEGRWARSVERQSSAHFQSVGLLITAPPTCLCLCVRAIPTAGTCYLSLNPTKRAFHFIRLPKTNYCCTGQTISSAQNSKEGSGLWGYMSILCNNLSRSQFFF